MGSIWKKRFGSMVFAKPFEDVGAGGRNRTDMELPPRDFESRASTSFTTPA
jgi:hypothetical protein